MFIFSLKDQARSILEATYTHSKNLAYFVFTYKSLCAIFGEMWGKPEQIHSFIAAFIGGYLVFGNYNKINEQVRGIFSVKHKQACTLKDRAANALYSTV